GVLSSPPHFSSVTFCPIALHTCLVRIIRYSTTHKECGMNAKMILGQLMKQATKAQSNGSYGKQRNGQHGQQDGGGFDLGKIVGGLASQLGGSSRHGRSHSGGIDVKSILGSGALSMLLGSKRGRSMGGSVLKYGALAGVGALA